MEDIGNIVYLIVLLLSFVFGIWQKANKKKEEEIPTPVETIEEDPFEFIQRELDPEMENKVPEPIVQESRERASDILERLEREAKEARTSRRTRFRSKEPVSNDPVEEDALEDLDLSDFDARKAVIYSEILSPPYL